MTESIASLAARLKPRPPVRVVVARWLCVVTLVAAVLTAQAWLLIPSVPVFLLLAWTSHLKRREFLRNLEGLPCLVRESPLGEGDAALPGVTLISPARNEEAGIERAARSRAALDYPELDVLIVDDHSTDDTPAILDRLAEEFPAIQVIHDPPLQEGWFGKASAIWHAVHVADPSKEWLVFADADVVFDPKVLRRAVAHAEAEALDFLTCVPLLETETLAEKLFLPAAWRNIIAGSPYDKLNDPKSFPVGLGAFSLVRRKAYLESGGHAAFDGQHPEDTLVAAIVKEWDGKLGVAWTPDLIRLRFYRGYRQIREFSVRKMRIICDDRLSYPLATLAMWLLWVLLPLPLSLVAVGRQVAAQAFNPALTCYAITGFFTYYRVLREHDRLDTICTIRPRVAWLHPLGGALGAWLSTMAVCQILLKTRMHWRGRESDVSA